ncbi:molybdopterin molybdenumtransferase MoeA [Halobacteriales archaeon QS_8_69_26]|nr:MAG: molybdopterin molybdenumtransferase MoeA [Halobacteriales archaeon QS_8_69_26]
MDDDRPGTGGSGPDDAGGAGFKRRTDLDAARDRLAAAVGVVDRTEPVPLPDADGRVLAESVAAGRDVPGYDRAAMDGYAVRAADTFDASDRSPAVLRRVENDRPEVGPGEAAPVHTGSPVPPGADAVVKVEVTETVGRDVEVFDAVAEGENVAPVGEDVEAGESLYEPGHRLRPSDLGLLRSVGVREVEVRDRPRAAVIPTGEELVDADPDRGEVVETNGLTVSRCVDRWGGTATYRDVVTDDADALRSAIEADLDHDIVVTTGGSSVGERDLVPDVVEGLGDVLVHGVALKPGHPVAVGRVEDTPVLALPGYPVSCIVTALQLLRPAVKWAGDMPLRDPPTMAARLARKLSSEPGVRTFARVRLTVEDGQRTAVPTRTGGAGVLSSVALADGWIEIAEGREGLPEGEVVAVQDWEYLL